MNGFVRCRRASLGVTTWAVTVFVFSNLTVAGGVFKYDRVFRSSYGAYGPVMSSPVARTSYYQAAPAYGWWPQRSSCWGFPSFRVLSGCRVPVCGPCGTYSGCATGNCSTGACGVPQTQPGWIPATPEQAPAGLDSSDSVPVPRTYEEPVPDRDNGGLPEGPPFENDSSFRPVKPEEAKPENENDFPNLDDLLQEDKTESFRPPVSAEPGKTEDPLDSPSPAPTGKPESDAGEASSGSESEARPAVPEPVEGESVPVPELILPEDTRKPAQADQSPEFPRVKSGSPESAQSRLDTTRWRIARTTKRLRSRIPVRENPVAAPVVIQASWLPQPIASSVHPAVAQQDH